MCYRWEFGGGILTYCVMPVLRRKVCGGFEPPISCLRDRRLAAWPTNLRLVRESNPRSLVYKTNALPLGQQALNVHARNRTPISPETVVDNKPLYDVDQYDQRQADASPENRTQGESMASSHVTTTPARLKWPVVGTRHLLHDTCCAQAHTPPRTRTWNLLLRRQTRYPLRQGS